MEKQQRWITHPIRISNGRLPTEVCQYKPVGRRDLGRSMKRGQKLAFLGYKKYEKWIYSLGFEQANHTL